jgi:hypothetical protein
MIKLTTRPARGQSVTEWLKTWDSALENAEHFTAGVTIGRPCDGVYQFGLMADQHPEWVKMLRTYNNYITYVITAWDTPMAVWVERGEGFWIMPAVSYRSPETGRKSTRTAAIQDRIWSALARTEDQINDTLDN